jgi:hypothetical protein
VTLVNTVIAGNSAPVGGSGLYCNGSSVDVVHSTLARNGGGGQGGIWLTSYGGTHSSVALINTILVSHTVGITVGVGNTATMQAVFWGDGAWANGVDWTGAGAISHTADYTGTVTFVDPDAGDYHLLQVSDAIDKGSYAGVEADIDGDGRPYGARFDLGADEWVYAQGIAGIAAPAQATTLVYTHTAGSPTVVKVPAGTVTETTVLAYTPVDTATAPAGYVFAGRGFRLEAYQDGVLLPGLQFANPVTITIHYTDSEVQGIAEDSLLLLYWNESTQTWEDAACGAYDRHPDENWLAAPVCHLTRFALFGKSGHKIYLPAILRQK